MQMTKPLQETRAFRDALGAFATGVTIVTTRCDDGEDVGLTANSFNSVSLDPPMILWSLSRRALSLSAFLGNPHFAVHVLAADQDEMSHLFATKGARKFDGMSLGRAAGDVPLIEGCSARFVCRTAFTYEGGDHLIFVGEVIDFEDFKRPPLLFHAGNYALAVQKQASDLPDPDGEPDSSFSRDFLIYLLGRARFQMMNILVPALERHSLNEEEWFVLSLLGVSDQRSIAELDHLLWYTGARITYELLARLASLGYVTLEGGHDPAARAHLTERGRAVVIELVAAAKAFETQAERSLGPGETQMLKNMLRYVIRDTDPGPPPLRKPSQAFDD
jgi:3-hydroxy-9,10-secoandrosta-1,3,5(10)-triene-9,17-dione monooxygenase reductase component